MMEKPMTTFTRRQALAASAALPFAGAAATSVSAQSMTDKLGNTQPTFHRFAVGEMEVTALLGGTRTVE